MDPRSPFPTWEEKQNVWQATTRFFVKNSLLSFQRSAFFALDGNYGETLGSVFTVRFPAAKGEGRVFFAVVCKLLWKWGVITFMFQELSRMLGFEANHTTPVISRNQDVYMSK